MNGFALDGGWYGIALGPHTRPDAEQVLRVCRNKGVIPRDSYIALGCTFCQHFWPMGAMCWIAACSRPLSKRQRSPPAG